MAVVFDIETNHLLEKVDTIHLIVARDLVSDAVDIYSTPRGNIREGVERLADEDMLIGHNIIGYDNRVIKKLYPFYKPIGKIIDTLVCSRLIWPQIADQDFKLHRQGRLPGKLIGSHKLEAWGYRLGDYKGDFDDWSKWSPEMEEYCIQDTQVTKVLWKLIHSKNYPAEALDIEHRVAHILVRQEDHGFLLDADEAVRFYARLSKRRDELVTEIRDQYPPFFMKDKEFTPKRDNSKMGYVAGCPMTKIKLVEMNPSSRHHIINRLTKVRGWKPTEFTPDGLPKVDEDILKTLPWPEAKLFNEYLMIDKRIGMLAEGKQAWLKLVRADGRIHGSVIGNGAVTGRMTHKGPNMAQIPSVDSPYGEECRALFTIVRKLFKLVGADASGLELRCLAHFLARWDGGEYAKVILEGDIHTYNQEAAGLPTRAIAKRFIYAWLYGAGDELIGMLVGGGKAEGRKLKNKFLRSIPAIRNLKQAVENAIKTRGFLVGLDGRRLHSRSLHSALNLLLQSAGALIMKRGLVILDDDLQAQGLVPEVDYGYCANVHDEWQIEARTEYAELVGETAVNAIRKAGEHFNFRIPLDGEYKIGNNWAETH